MANVDNPAAAPEMAEVETIAQRSGLQVVTAPIRRTEDIAPTIAALMNRADALYVCGDPLAATNQVQINALALKAHLPTMHAIGEYVKSGGLMSYGPNFQALWRRGADYVDKILRGAKPADLPVEQPTKFDLIINLKVCEGPRPHRATNSARPCQ